MKNKYTLQDVNEWKRQGAVVINDIFSEEEIMADLGKTKEAF